MAKKGEWPKSYVIPSVILTLACGGLLYWHLKDPTRKVDAWAVTLLVVGFLPWLRTVFESIGFPGGGEVKYRDLKQSVERQEDEIRALRFVVAHFLPDAELRVLEKLAAPEPYTLIPGRDEFFNASGPLRGLGFIEPILGENGIERFNMEKDLKIAFRLTDRGREYLELRKKTDPGA